MANWFEIQTTRGMLNKARREFRRLTSATTLDDYLDAAMNCAVAIWHVRDWLYAEGRSKLEPLCSFKGDKDDLYRLTAWLKKQPEMGPILVCADLTNGSKHMDITRYPDVMVRSSRNSAVNPANLAAPGPATIGSTVFNVIDPDPPHVVDGQVLKVDFRDGTTERGQTVLRNAISAWDAILTRHDLP